jgi:hypothetical protein
MGSLVDEQALDERLARLEAARPWSPRVVSRLEAVIRAGDDAALFRINPLRFAGERGLADDEAIDLFLHATALGLFEMDWLLVCPRCACAVESFANLRAVLRLFRCPECHNEYEAAMDDFIAVYFSISPQICAIRYHRPATLEPFDYIVQQHFDRLRAATVRHGGAVVKTIGDAVMATYPDAALAVGAALDMHQTIERFNADQPERSVALKIGIHHGAAIAVTLNNELDYFGQTVNIASRVQEMADAGEIWVTEDVWRYPGAQALLTPTPTETRTVAFRASTDR